MNEKLLDVYFSRRKETTTRLLLCMSVGGLLAVASRVPILFIWAIGPFVVMFFQAFALQSQAEAEGLRQTLLRTSTSGQNRDGLNNAFDPNLEELTPQWKKGLPAVIHMITLLFWIAPVIVNIVLFTSYLNFVRPDAHGNWRYPTRSAQVVDAFCGIGGWNWFQPLAPSLQSNLESFQRGAASADDREKYRRLEEEIPWTIFPFQTWLYLMLLLVSVDSALFGIEYARGTNSPKGLFRRLRGMNTTGLLRRRTSPSG
jgi:hypothetical protein